MSFAHASGETTIRAAAAVSVTDYAYADGPTKSTGRVAQIRSTQIGFTVKVAARTAGTLVTSVQGRTTTSDTWRDLGTTLQTTFSTNRQATVFPTTGGPLPAFLRVVLTPAGGFDGTAQVVMSASPPEGAPEP